VQFAEDWETPAVMTEGDQWFEFEFRWVHIFTLEFTLDRINILI
jgi:hypothetical protein